MFQGRKVQSPWDFRKQNDINSSDDAAGSASSGEPVSKKLKQMSDLMSIKFKEESSINNSDFLKRKSVMKGDKMQILRHKKEGVSSNSRVNTRPLQSDDLKIKMGRPEPITNSTNHLYMQSVLEELRVARENMLEWMRGEVRKLEEDSTAEVTEEEGSSKWKRIKFKCRGRVESINNVGMPFVSEEPREESPRMTSREVTCSVNPGTVQFPPPSSYLTHNVLPKYDVGRR